MSGGKNIKMSEVIRRDLRIISVIWNRTDIEEMRKRSTMRKKK